MNKKIMNKNIIDHEIDYNCHCEICEEARLSKIDWLQVIIIMLACTTVAVILKHFL